MQNFIIYYCGYYHINVLTERNVFEALRAWLTKFKLSYRQLFWITGSIFIIAGVDKSQLAILRDFSRQG